MASMTFQLFGLLGIMCLLSTLSIAGGLEMYTIPKILATCGENVTLKCDITTDSALDIKEFNWKEKKDICDWGVEKNRTDMACANMTSKNSYNYTLSIFNIQPKHKGTYHCKLRSKEGVKNGQTIVRVQKCVGQTSVSVSSTEGTCVFENIFPKPVKVMWKQGYESILDLSTNVTENTDGLFTAVSTVRLRKDPLHKDPYNCSLLVPTENEMNQTTVEVVRFLTFAGGENLIAHWFGVMLALVLGMFMVQA
ncbi:uncharacterized protein [Eucyclogobius newberryi]|uniref:uncharacterized protein n=1 Tax=Eucyclogobius newberryi TaxID=166745 RepID=UPI003B5B3973